MPDLASRLRLNEETGCLEFTGGKNGKGYGTVWSAGRVVLAHRLAWQEAHGPIPDGLLVCHRCDNPPCCNADHLFLGTVADNNRDRADKGRGVMGERVHTARLTEAQVSQILAEREGGASFRSLARRYGVANSTISAILTGQSWKHIQRLGATA